MNQLELLAPARDRHIGIAAIDCGADAVYIAGPRFGARQAAGNEMEDIRQLCEYAHRFGARIFVTLNTILYDDELEEAWQHMIAVQEAGADALIVQDMAIVAMARDRGYSLPLHASTQCAIRTPEQAVFLESLGFSRLILERELSLEQIKAIRAAVSCELEFFVHGALCVCYSGQCYLSEHIAGRSANRGACIQACRSRYDLTDGSGRILVRDKALLSLKDYNLRNRLEELADAGITSFKIEGRLKNSSYVRNVVRDYSLAIDEIISRRDYVRGSFGSVSGGFTPDTCKTFNRGYTELYLDGIKGKWACMDAAKSMGEEIGQVIDLNRDKSSIVLRLSRKDIILNNGDGFSFVAKDGSISGFRGDVCNGNSVRCKNIPSLFIGARIFRNINAAFEKEIERQACIREIGVSIFMDFTLSETGSWTVEAEGISEDGRKVSERFDAGEQIANNRERMMDMIRTQIGKSSGGYRFSLGNNRFPETLPFMSASALNAIRRRLAEILDTMPCGKKDILLRDPEKVMQKAIPLKDVTYKANVANRLAKEVYTRAGASTIQPAYEISPIYSAELMRTKYCIRYELGICPKHHGAKAGKALFLLNNGQRFALGFDCANCEMTVKEA